MLSLETCSPIIEKFKLSDFCLIQKRGNKKWNSFAQKKLGRGIKRKQGVKFLEHSTNEMIHTKLQMAENKKGKSVNGKHYHLCLNYDYILYFHIQIHSLKLELDLKCFKKVAS